ncbi:MAG: hypothetical protein ACRCS6_06415, partial [Turicibacter sp.]
LFATEQVNPAGANGLFYGDLSLLVKQCIGIGATVVYAAMVTAMIYYMISKFMMIRVSEEEEEAGLDYSLHGERAYSKFID